MPASLRQLRVLLLGLLCLPAGCGTVVNCLDVEGPQVFGGVRTDAAFIHAAWTSTVPRAWWAVPAYGGYFLVDLPLSCVADVALLPLTVPLALASGSDEPVRDLDGEPR